MARIVTTLKLPRAALATLSPLGEIAGPEDWRFHLDQAEGLISLVTTPVTAELLRSAPKLRIVANAGVGYDNLDLEACRRGGVIATNTPDVLTGATADLTMALILATVRRLPQAEQSLRRGAWRGWGFWDYLGGDIAGAALGIYGMGRIGQAVARRARAFDMKVQYFSRTRLPDDLETALGVTRVEWDALLTTSDVLSLHAPSTPATRHLLNAESLARMKPGSYLVNTARGALVDEAALVRALAHGPLAGAGLDVYEREPEVHPGLLDLPNVVLLPHIGSATPDTRTAMAVLAAKNIAAVLGGGEPLTPITL
jgi:glyoxylate reductase